MSPASLERVLREPIANSMAEYALTVRLRETLAAVGQGGLLDDEAVNLYFALLQERNNRAILCNERCVAHIFLL